MRTSSVLGLSLMLAACGGEDAAGDGGTDGGGGSLGQHGDPCTYTADCEEPLYCSEFRVCDTAGTGVDGDSCDRTADCARGFTCVREPEGWVCRMAGDRGVGDPCLRHEQCAAGLFCHMGTCTGDAPDAGPGGFDGGATTCSPGSGECDDGSNCTTDSCIADTCVYTLIDSDMDGFASTVLGSCGTDCADMDEGAHPDQTEFSGEMHGGGPGQPRGYDWNCDGVAERRHTAVLGCSGDPCDSGEGWLDPLPECGATARWGRCTGSGLSCGEEVLEPSRQQTCR